MTWISSTSIMCIRFSLCLCREAEYAALLRCEPPLLALLATPIAHSHSSIARLATTIKVIPSGDGPVCSASERFGAVQMLHSDMSVEVLPPHSDDDGVGLLLCCLHVILLACILLLDELLLSVEYNQDFLK